MTADLIPIVHIPTAEEIAFDPRFADGGWRDRQGRNLVEHLVFHLGRKGARRLLNAADDLVCGSMTLVGPRPYDRVAPISDVDHAKVPDQDVTCCGLELAQPFHLTDPRGRSCPLCFGDLP